MEYAVDLDKIKEERNAKFLDLFADRQLSVRRHIEDTFQQEMHELEEKEKERKRVKAGDEPVTPPTPEPPVVPVRYRHQPIQGPLHDVFGDALHTTFQKLMARGQMAEYCHYLSYLLTQRTDERNETKLEGIEFKSDVYENQGTDEIKKRFVDQIWTSADSILVSSADKCPALNDKWRGIYVSADQKKGSRHRQEDRFLAYPSGLYINRSEDPIALLAVFDGHGGAECSQYAAGHMWEEWIACRRQALADAGDLTETLTNALNQLDRRLTVRSEKEQWKGGTTAVCCAVDIENKQMAFAWLGDSPGYIMNNLEFRKVTREHSPSDPEEARRVEEAGGQLFIIGGELRVNGVLNLTRALGDVQGRPMISNEPETAREVIECGDYLVLLACDGISDVFDVRRLYVEVEKFVTSHPARDYTDLARHICRAAIEEGSGDNVTVVIGFLRPPQDLWNLMGGANSSQSGTDSTGETSSNSGSDVCRNNQDFV